MVEQTRRPARRLFAAVVVVAALTAAPQASADAVTDWNAQAVAATLRAQQPPHVAMTTFAMVHGAAYDAVNGIVRSHRPYLTMPRANPGDSQDAAAATAAYRVLLELFPTQQGLLDGAYTASLALVPNGPGKAGGISAGEEAAAAMLSARSGDGRGSAFQVAIGAGPGEWRPTPPAFVVEPAPWLANVRPFAFPNAGWLRTAGPPKLTSRAYAHDFAEVKEVGSLTSSTRTADQTDTARYWNDPAIWPRLLSGVAQSQLLDTAARSRMFASATMAAADALIGCWKEKYRWSFWRPVTAIREAASDGNPATEPDAAWTPLLVTPPFPEHPSGHACATGAIATSLIGFFGTDRVSLGAFSNVSQSTRTFARISQTMQEVVDARVWSGIHFRTADEQGTALGILVGAWQRLTHFQPLGRRY